MIAIKDSLPLLSPEEYFSWEAQQSEKYEYIEGRVYAMEGGTVNHSRIAVSFITLLETHLENTDCFTGKLRLKGQHL